jgi:hypothetical protein
MEKRFSIATKYETKDGDDIWHCESSSFNEAMEVLLHNGWKECDAISALYKTPEEWILVNNFTQIC